MDRQGTLLSLIAVITTSKQIVAQKSSQSKFNRYKAQKELQHIEVHQHSQSVLKLKVGASSNTSGVEFRKRSFGKGVSSEKSIF